MMRRDGIFHKPGINVQGKCICEWSERDGHWLIMLPNGTIDHRVKKADAERLCKRWFHVHNDNAMIGYGIIEWKT